MTVTIGWQDIYDAISLTLPLTANANSTWWVAYSGGLDSSVLLHAIGKMAAMSTARFPEVKALHINHGLSPHAGQWTIQCEREASRLSIPIEVVEVGVRNQGAGIEAAARQARYQVFEEKLVEGGCLLLGHHLNDQAETVLFRLFRGHGLAGLAGIPDQRRLGNGSLYRPLLNIPRVRLESLAMEWGLHWVNDDSNGDQSLDRNFIRHRVMPTILSRWPSALQRMGKSAQWFSEAKALTEALAEIDLRSVACNEASLNTRRFMSLTLGRQKNLLTFWLHQCEVVISERHLETTLNLIRTGAAKPAQIKLQNDTELFVSRASITCLHLSALAAARHSLLWTAADQTDCMVGKTPLGELRLVAVKKAVDKHLLLRKPKKKETISVRYRVGGERLRPNGRGGSCTLKKWLQENEVPVWQRNLIPLIYYGERLAAIADLAVDEAFYAEQDGLQVSIRYRPQHQS